MFQLSLKNILKYISWVNVPDKSVKTVMQPLSSLQEYQLQPSSPFVATIVTANILYIK